MHNKTLYDLWHKDIHQRDVQRYSIRAKKLYDEIIESLGITFSAKGSLLDIACGKGLFLSALKAYNNNLDLYGSDISEYAINNAQKIVDAKFEVADGEHLPYKNNFFDFCTCLGGLEYYQNPQNGAKEIARVLKPDGKAVIFVPNLMFLGYIWLALRHGVMPTHGGTINNKTYYDWTSEKFYTHKGWTDILEKNGLEIIRSLAFNFIGSTRFANSFVLKAYNLFLNKFIPFNLSHCFIFICQKK